MIWAAVCKMVVGRTVREIPVWIERLRWIGRKRPEATGTNMEAPDEDVRD